MAEKKITVAKLAKFIAIRSTSLPSNMQFGIDLKRAGLTHAMLGEMLHYKDTYGWSLYVWKLTGDLERTHRLIEFGGQCFLAPAAFLEIPDEFKHIESPTHSVTKKDDRLRTLSSRVSLAR
ncbi:MAG: hypothetical protein PVSMB8_00290 [Vulcanimicrobiaceae bacterium]